MTAEATGLSIPSRVVLAVVLPLSMVFLAITLIRACEHGRGVIEAYVRTVRGGAVVSAAVGGDEAEALTAMLRAGPVVSIGNFQGQQGTSCYWTTLQGGGRATEVRFVLGDDDTRVVAMSARKSCECPEDFEQPCRLVE